MQFDINRIFARPFQTNIASQKVLEKCGFTLEATLLKQFLKIMSCWMK
jgi:RimJ/RimL family protein N-acetyltransferase